MIKLITDKIFFCFYLFSFFRYIKVTNNCTVIKKSEKSFQKKTCERYQNLSEEKKEKKAQYACERYRNLSEEKKEKKRQHGSE